jgi:hypothetical protein
MASSDKGKQKRQIGNQWGHYRKAPSVEEFEAYFDRSGGVSVLKQFCGNTASWVYENFAPVELEVHQAVTMGRAAKQGNGTPNYDAVKKQCRRLAIVATDAELKRIVEPPEGAPKVKDLTAEIFSRVLERSKESIKKWAQRKK